jgi:hypothetical protein
MPEQRLRRAWDTYQGTLEDRVSRLSGDFRVSRYASAQRYSAWALPHGVSTRSRDRDR